MTNFKFFLAGLCCFMAGWFIVSVIVPVPISEARKAAIAAEDARKQAEQIPGCIYIDPKASKHF